MNFGRDVEVLSSGTATARVGSVSGTALLTWQLTLSADVVLHADSAIYAARRRLTKSAGK